MHTCVYKSKQIRELSSKIKVPFEGTTEEKESYLWGIWADFISDRNITDYSKITVESVNKYIEDNHESLSNAGYTSIPSINVEYKNSRSKNPITLSFKDGVFKAVINSNATQGSIVRNIMAELKQHNMGFLDANQAINYWALARSFAEIYNTSINDPRVIRSTRQKIANMSYAFPSIIEVNEKTDFKKLIEESLYNKTQDLLSLSESRFMSSTIVRILKDNFEIDENQLPQFLNNNSSFQELLGYLANNNADFEAFIKNNKSKIKKDGAVNQIIATIIAHVLAQQNNTSVQYTEKIKEASKESPLRLELDKKVEDIEDSDTSDDEVNTEFDLNPLDYAEETRSELAKEESKFTIASIDKISESEAELGADICIVTKTGVRIPLSLDDVTDNLSKRQWIGALYKIEQFLKDNPNALDSVGEVDYDIKSEVKIEKKEWKDDRIEHQFAGNMKESYSEDDEGNYDNAIDAIINGEKTAMTKWGRSLTEYFINAKVGDIIELHSEGRSILVRVTEPFTKLASNTAQSTWSKKECYGDKYFTEKVKPHIKGGTAYQLQFEYVEDSIREDTGLGVTKKREAVKNKDGKFRVSTTIKFNSSIELNKDKNFKNSIFSALVDGTINTTTRIGNVGRWKKFKKGDVVALKTSKGATAYFRIAEDIQDINLDTLDVEEWSRNNGYTVDYFNRVVSPKMREKNSKGKENGAVQIKLEFIDPNLVDTKSKTLEEEAREKREKSKDNVFVPASADEAYYPNVNLATSTDEITNYTSNRNGTESLFRKFIENLQGKIKKVLDIDYNKILNVQTKLKIQNEYTVISRLLHRKENSEYTNLGKSSRNYINIAHRADALYVVGNLIVPTEKYNTYLERPVIRGEVSYAAEAAILDKKPVYFYDLHSKNWKFFDYELNTFRVLKGKPKVYKNSAFLGTDGKVKDKEGKYKTDNKILEDVKLVVADFFNNIKERLQKQSEFTQTKNIARDNKKSNNINEIPGIDINGKHITPYNVFTSRVFRANQKFNREEAAGETDNLYIFADNTDRDSGSNKVDPNSEYAKKYGKDKHYPEMTQAVLRGLDNAMPISTQKWYHKGAKGKAGRWLDENTVEGNKDVELFKETIAKEVDDIIEKFRNGDYRTITISAADNFFNGQYSELTYQRAPRLYNVLLEELYRLNEEIEAIREEKGLDDDIEGIEISSNSKDDLGKDLTNAGNQIGFTFKGKKFINAEHAYQTWKSGEFDTEAYYDDEFKKGEKLKPSSSKEVNKETNYQLMVDILIAKLEQNPELYNRVLMRGGDSFIENSTHIVKGDSFWESGEGNQDMFIKALAEAFAFIRQNDLLVDKLHKDQWNAGDMTDSVDLTIDNNYEGEVLIAKDSALYRISMNLDVERINNRINSIAREVSKTISVEARSYARALRKKVSNGTATNQEIVILENIINAEDLNREAIPYVIGDVFTRVKNKFIKEYEFMLTSSDQEIKYNYNCEDAEYLKEQYRILTENYDDFFDMACIAIEKLESIRIIRNENNKITTEETDQQKAIEEQQDGDNAETSRSNGNEGYSYEAKLVDPHDSQRAVVKRLLSSIRDIDYTGKHAVDDIGNMKYIDSNVAMSVLLNEFAKKVHSADDFSNKDKEGVVHYPVLENMVGRFPWVEQVLQEIQNNESLASAMYTGIALDFIKYSTQYDVDEGGNTITNRYKKHGLGRGAKGRHVKYLNEPVAASSMFDAIVSTYNTYKVLNNSPIWNTQGEYVIANAEKVQSRMEKIREKLKTASTLEGFLDDIAEGLKSIGIFTTVDNLKLTFPEKNQDTVKAFKKLIDNIDLIANVSTKLNKEISIVQECKSIYMEIADMIGVVDDARNATMFHMGKNDYPSYSTPNYITYLKNSIKGKSAKDIHAFLQNEYSYDEFFGFDAKKETFRCLWLNLLYNNQTIRDNFDIKYVKMSNNIDYEDWDENDISVTAFTEFISEPINSAELNFAHYQFPIFSDSTMAAFIRMPKYIDNYKNVINKHLLDVALQEVTRINRVRARKEKGISNGAYDKRGLEFCFLTYLNDITIDTKVSELSDIQKKTIKVQDSGGNLISVQQALDSNILSSEDTINAKLNEYCSDLNNESLNKMKDYMSRAIEINMEQKANKYIEKNREVIYPIEGADSDEQAVNRKALSEKEKAAQDEELRIFYYNNVLAQSQIIQLTTTDLAYYKNYTDFQKRFKQVYASGSRLNTNSKYGRKVERSIYFKDWIMTNPTYNGFQTSLQKAFEKGLISAHDYEQLLVKAKNINAADGQAFRSLSSYRAVLDMQGLWSTKMQNTFERFTRGEWDNDDFNIVWGVIKPFVFSNAPVEDGIGGQMRAPLQHKNSEYLLLSFLQGVELHNEHSKSPQMKAINKALEDFNIDVAMFESASKAYSPGIIDITYSKDKLEEFKKSHRWQGMLDLINIQDKELKALMDEAKELEEFDISKASDFEIFKFAADFMLQHHIFDKDNSENNMQKYLDLVDSIQMTEEEIYDTIDKAIHGTVNEEGVREEDGNNYYENSITGELENPDVVHEVEYRHYMIAQPTVNHLVDSESVEGSQFRNLIVSDLPDDFEVTIGGVKYDKQGLLKLYDSIHAENLLDDWEACQEIFGSLEALQEKLVSIVKGNPSYGYDMLNAIQIIEVPDGKGGTKKTFNIPTHNTIMSAKIEQLLFSIFKNEITKQHMKGAACVLVSNFGFSKDLKIVRDSEGAITHFECKLPAHMKDMFDLYLKDIIIYDESNNPKVVGQEINMQKIKDDNAEGLLEAIGFRIPTEGKYSMANLLVTGFLPQQCGATIMLPAETTLLAGEDFDVDKKFILFKESYRHIKYDWNAAKKDFLNSEEGAQFKQSIDIKKAQEFREFLDGKFISLEEYDKKTVAEKKELKREFYKQKGKNFDELQFADDGDAALNAFNLWFKEINKQTKDKQGRSKYWLDESLRVINYDYKKDCMLQSRKARSNAIVEISRAIMSHPKISYIVNKSGNYDTLGVTSDRSLLLRSIRSEEDSIERDLINKWCKLVLKKDFNLNITKEVANSIMNANDEDIKKFVKKNKTELDPLDADTFAFYHKQNMVGKKLVAIYANENTSQGKYQRANIGINENYIFTINGYEINNVCNQYREEVHNGKVIKKLISTNLAEFLAASVDNTKDPKIANLMQSTDNAFITGAMLRMGLSIEEIGLFFSLPIFENSDFKYTVESLLNAYPGAEEYYNRINLEIDNDELLSVISNNADEDLQNKVYGVLAKIVTIAERMKTLTQVSRCDSPNGAISNTLAGAIHQTMMLDSFHAREERDEVLTNTDTLISNEMELRGPRSKDSIRKALRNHEMTMIQAFHYLGISDALNTASGYFNQYSTTAIENLRYLNEQCAGFKVLEEDVIQKYLRHSVVYHMTKSSLFNKDTEKQRLYYLNTFPSVCMDKLEDSKFEQFGICSLITRNKCGDLIIPKSTKLKGINDRLCRDLNMMLFSEDPEIRDMAIDLFKYSYFADGLDWRVDGFSLLFDSLFLSSLPSYINTLRTIDFNQDGDKYLEQFIYNNASDLFISIRNNKKKGIFVPYVKGGRWGITKNNNPEIARMIRNGKTDTWYDYIIVNKEHLMKIDLEHSTDEEAAYIEIDWNSSDVQFYNANTNSAHDMHVEWNSILNPDFKEKEIVEYIEQLEQPEQPKQLEQPESSILPGTLDSLKSKKSNDYPSYHITEMNFLREQLEQSSDKMRQEYEHRYNKFPEALKKAFSISIKKGAKPYEIAYVYQRNYFSFNNIMESIKFTNYTFTKDTGYDSDDDLKHYLEKSFKEPEDLVSLIKNTKFIYSISYASESEYNMEINKIVKSFLDDGSDWNRINKCELSKVLSF